MAASNQDGVVIPEKPHQPHTYSKRSFGKKTIILRSFQPDWFNKWPFLHYDEARDVVF